MATKHHILIAGDLDIAIKASREAALIHHYPEYAKDTSCRTRISVIVADMAAVHEFLFEFKELLDNSYWRVVDLTSGTPKIELHRPQYEGLRKDFVDIEWEFIIGSISNPMVQDKIKLWSSDPDRSLSIILCYGDKERDSRYEERLRRRFPADVSIRIYDTDPESERRRIAELLEMAKYLNYFYQASYELQHVPTELPEAEVNKAWEKLDDTLKRSNLYSVMSIPVKMEILGHSRDDWDALYALTAGEVDRLTEVEHNRWVAERLIQGSRPCTDEERREIEEDFRRRLTDKEYTGENPVSLKKRYKTERNAHFDICAFSDLGVDETGLSVVRYDRDLIAALPLIVKTFNDRHSGNG